MPSGSYAVVDNSKLGAQQPGAIFLFREKGGEGSEQPAGPGRLVYATTNGPPASHRESIHAFREAAAGLAQPNNELCDRFNLETEQGADMAAYDRLCQGARAARPANAAMEWPETGAAAKAEPAAATEYELVTWLAILDRNKAAPSRNWTAQLPPSIAVKLTTSSHGDVPNLTDQQLYNAARRRWAVQQTAREQAKYVLAVHQDKVVAVYEPERWRRAPNENRIFSFSGKPAPAAIQELCLGQDFPLGRSRRVAYINMEGGPSRQQ